MVVAQLVERSLLTPEIRGSNRVIVNFNINYQLHQNDKKEKRGGNGRLSKTIISYLAPIALTVAVDEVLFFLNTDFL